jgi:hypothetical protein
MPEGNVFLLDVEPSRGRVRIVDFGGGRYGFQDPDAVSLYQRPDGSVFTVQNPFVGNMFATQRVTYEPELGFLSDSLGNRVPIGALRMPGGGSVVDYKTVKAVWEPLGVDPRSFTPTHNQEIVERVVFLDAEGRLQTLNLSYGEGEKYDRSKTGEKWRWFATKMTGEDADPGEGNRTDTRELQKHVVVREFLVKTIRPRGAGVTGAQ